MFAVLCPRTKLSSWCCLQPCLKPVYQHSSLESVHHRLTALSMLKVKRMHSVKGRICKANILWSYQQFLIGMSNVPVRKFRTFYNTFSTVMCVYSFCFDSQFQKTVKLYIIIHDFSNMPLGYVTNSTSSLCMSFICIYLSTMYAIFTFVTNCRIMPVHLPL